MSELFKENDAVFRIRNDIVTLSSVEINFLHKNVNNTSKNRNRICTHHDNSSDIHEMHICLGKNTYIRPAKHLNKTESLSVISGSALLYFFHEDGKIRDIIKLGEYTSGHTFFYRMNLDIYHTLIVLSDYFIFHEVTKGPLNIEDTIMSEWSPDEEDQTSIDKFLINLENSKIDQYVSY